MHHFEHFLCAATLVLSLAIGTGAAAASLAVEPIQPLPDSLAVDPARAALGRRLFVDTRLSGSNRISCASCHDLDRGGADARARSIGIDGRLTDLNAPTVLNAALNFRQFWNGRAESLESQVDQVVENPNEMGSRWVDVVAKLMLDRAYRSGFAAAYRDGLTRANITHALASYERTLLTPDSRFDRYLRGDAAAITSDERNGYLKFKQYGCAACHQGVNIGGNMFQRFGVMSRPMATAGDSASLGRYLVTGAPADAHVFKVPGLRNVAQTAPYFHDGSAATLEEAVDVMFRVQLGRIASIEDRAAIVRFLGTLSAPLAASK